MQRIRPLLSIVFIGLGVTLLLVILAWPDLPSLVGDSGWYLAIAQGRLDDVRQPYATRILNPYAARWLAEMTGCSLDASFRGLAIAALLALTCAVTLLLRAGRGLAVPLLATPLLLLLFRDYYMPDIFYAGLLAIFLLLLRRESKLTYVLLTLLFLARESTILVSFMLLIYAVLHRRPWIAIATLVATAIGMLVPAIVTAGAQSNVHAISGPLYLALKVPFNVARNLMGAELWVNTLPGCEPVWRRTLPSMLQIGEVREFGACEFSGKRPLSLASYVLTSFGVLPFLTFGMRRRIRENLRSLPAWVIVAGGSGLISFVLTPGLGLALDRLISYAWPLFWLATPYFASQLSPQQADWKRLALIHAAICWTPWILDRFGIGFYPYHAITIAIAVPLQVIAYRSYRLSVR